MKEWFVGTSGFMTSRSKWLDLPNLNCIEINSTFYGLPSAKTVEGWKEAAPDLFFSVKCSKYITHIKRLKDCKAAWNEFWGRVKPLGKSLQAVLIQLPPSFKNTDETLERVADMIKYLPKESQTGTTMVFEFRDKSWFVGPVFELMKKHNITMGGTSIERPTKARWLGDLPTGLHIPPRTSNATYLRVHGEKGYKGNYSQGQLETIKKKIASRGTQKNFVMFNNTFFPKRNKTCKIGKEKIRYAAVCNAVEFGGISEKGKKGKPITMTKKKGRKKNAK